MGVFRDGNLAAIVEVMVTHKTKGESRACASAAAVCVAGAVLLGAAWVAVAKRWKTPAKQGSVKDNAATTRALLAAHLRAMSSGPAAAVRSPPLLLLCAAHGDKASVQAAAQAPARVSAMPRPSLAVASVLLSNLPLFVGVDDVTGELVMRMRGDSVGNAVCPMTMGPLDCGWRTARWRKEQQAAQEARKLITYLLSGRARGMAFGPEAPLLLLCAAADHEKPPAQQIDLAHALTLMLSASLPSLTDVGAFLSSIPMLVGVGDTTKELPIGEVQKIEPVTFQILLRRQEEEYLASPSVPGLLSNTTLPLLLCDQENTPDSLQAVTDGGTEVVAIAAKLQESPPMAARRPPSSPSKSSRARESLWTPPDSSARKSSSSQVNNNHPIKTSFAPPMLWGLPVVNRDKLVARDRANAPTTTTTASLGQGRRVLDASADPVLPPKGGQGSSDDGDADGACGGGRVSKATRDSGGGGGGASSTSSENKRPHILWMLPGQIRVAAGVAAGVRPEAHALMSGHWEAHGGSMSAEIASKPMFTREGEGGAGGNYDDGGVGTSTGGTERLSLSGSLLRSALALTAQTHSPPVTTSAPPGRSDLRSPSWALGKARRGSLSPKSVGKYGFSQSDGGGGGQGGRAPNGSPSRKDAVVSGDAGTTPPPAPRSILVTGKGPASARRTTAISRGVRWLDIVENEEEQAISRRKRAARWTGGCRKREGPPTASPRASRALGGARENEVAVVS
eukprot:g5795.t1